MAARHPYRQGDLVLVQFPYSGPSGQKNRPAIVLSTDVYHDQWDELLVAALTSRPPKTPRTADCPIRDWQAAGLQQPPWMRSHLATVHRQLILGKIGSMTPNDWQTVEGCLRLALGL